MSVIVLMMLIIFLMIKINFSVIKLVNIIIILIVCARLLSFSVGGTVRNLPIEVPAPVRGLFAVLPKLGLVLIPKLLLGLSEVFLCVLAYLMLPPIFVSWW